MIFTDVFLSWEVDYDSTTTEIDNIPFECENRNSDPCAINACKVEQHFITLIFQFFLGGNQHTDANSHANGFDVKEECKTEKSPQGPSEHSCCGFYPERRPFKTTGPNQGQRGCCGSKTYDLNTLECCGEGENATATVGRPSKCIGIGQIFSQI